MAIRRAGRFQPPASSLTTRRSYATPAISPGMSRVSSSTLDSRVEDYLLSGRVSDANFLSNATLDESDDTVRRSRGRDQKLLRDATSAIVSSESYATPQSSVAARRVARGRSLPPRAASVPPRPLYPTEVVPPTPSETSTTFATISRAFRPNSYARRPVVVMAASGPGRRGDRAMSVPPVVLFREDLRQRARSQAPDAPAAQDWRRQARARSVAPQVLQARAARARSVPPQYLAEAPAPYPGRRVYYQGSSRVRPLYYTTPQVPLPTAELRAHKVPRRFLTRGGIRTGFTSLRGYGPGGRADEAGVRKQAVRARVLATPVVRHFTPLLPLPKPKKPAPLRESLSNFPQVYVPSKGRKPSNRSKAAIIASKMEPDPLKRRRPRSEFAANKYRAMRRDAQESIYSGGRNSGGLYASSPPLPKLSEAKAIRTDDGYTKPKNLLSWQYRLESKMTPGDLLYYPSSFIRIREQVRDAQERMDRHRQMLDRYLPEEGVESGDVATNVLRKMNDMDRRTALDIRG